MRHNDAIRHFLNCFVDGYPCRDTKSNNQKEVIDAWGAISTQIKVYWSELELSQVKWAFFFQRNTEFIASLTTLCWASGMRHRPEPQDMKTQLPEWMNIQFEIVRIFARLIRFRKRKRGFLLCRGSAAAAAMQRNTFSLSFCRANPRLFCIQLILISIEN